MGASGNEWKDLFIDGTAHIDTLDVDANAGIIGNLTVTGTSEFNNAVNVDANFAVRSGTTSKFTVASSSGDIATDGTLTVDNHAELNDTLNVDGNTTLGGTLSVTNNATLSSNLTVTGNSVFNGNIDLGNATSDTITPVGRFDASILPASNGAYNLGASGLEFLDLHLTGTAHILSLIHI